MSAGGLSEDHRRIEAKIDLLITLLVKSVGQENVDKDALTVQQQQLLSEVLEQTREYWWSD